MSIPTGIIRAEAATDWGAVGSILNFTIGAGARLTNMKAACQGSACTEIIGEENKEEDGEVKQREDGSWFMKVTKKMQHSLMVTGEAVAAQAGTSKRKFLLHVSATPPCGLPIAKNCTSDDFIPDLDQWDAYSMSDYLKEWLDKTGVRSFEEFGEKSMREYLPALDAERQECNITQELKCELPGSAECKEKPDKEGTRKMMMIESFVGLTQCLHHLYMAADDVKNTIDAEIDSIVTKVWQEAAKMTWSLKTAIASSVAGLMIMAAVVIDFLLPPAAAVIGTALIAGTIGASNALGFAGNWGNANKDDPASSDAQTKKSAKYTMEAHARLDATKDNLVTTMTSEETGPDGIYEMFKTGAWVSREVRNLIKDGLRAEFSQKLRIEMGGQYLSRAITDNNGFILFVKYTDNAPYSGRNWHITQKQCEDRYQGNPHWKYSVICDATYQPGGPLGMAVLSRPEDEGLDTLSWFKDPVVIDGHNVTARDVMTSAMHGQYLHGFNYTLLGRDDWADQLAHNGVESVKEAFRSQGPDQPGRYTIPVCEIEEIGYVPNIGQVANDWYSSSDSRWKKGREAWPGAPGPCSCAGYWFQPKGGSKGHFKDFVSEKVADIISDCKVDKWSKVTEENPLPH